MSNPRVRVVPAAAASPPEQGEQRNVHVVPTTTALSNQGERVARAVLAIAAPPPEQGELCNVCDVLVAAAPPPKQGEQAVVRADLAVTAPPGRGERVTCPHCRRAVAEARGTTQHPN